MKLTDKDTLTLTVYAELNKNLSLQTYTNIQDNIQAMFGSAIIINVASDINNNTFIVTATLNYHNAWIIDETRSKIQAKLTELEV